MGCAGWVNIHFARIFGGGSWIEVEPGTAD